MNDGATGRNVSVEDAPGLIYGYAIGLDMTRRDLQLEARESGRPWDTGKNVEESKPLGPIHPVGSFDPASGSIRLTVNGDVKQDADLTELIWPVADVVSHVSRYYRLQPGDLIYTGTPAGVGAVVEGDVMVATIDGLGSLTVTVGPPLV